MKKSKKSEERVPKYYLVRKEGLHTFITFTFKAYDQGDALERFDNHFKAYFKDEQPNHIKCRVSELDYIPKVYYQ